MSDSWPPPPALPRVVDATRPLMLGYLRADLCGTQRDLARSRHQMADLARLEGYALGSVLTEYPSMAPAVLDSLIQIAKHDRARAVVAPCRQHLTVLGAQTDLTAYLERVADVRVFFVEHLARCPVSPGLRSSGVGPRSPP